MQSKEDMRHKKQYYLLKLEWKRAARKKIEELRETTNVMIFIAT